MKKISIYPKWFVYLFCICIQNYNTGLFEG